MSLDLVAILTTFVTIFLAELPDKSMFASIILATRFRPLPVWIGLAAAFLVHGVIAVTAGGLVGLLPHRVVSAIVFMLFAAGATLMIFHDDDAKSEGEDEANDAGTGPRSTGKVIATAFGVVFVSEWGDLTQISAISLTDKFQSPLSVLIGAVVALWLVCGLGVLAGRRLMKVVPVRLIKFVAAGILTLLAAWSFVDLVRG